MRKTTFTLLLILGVITLKAQNDSTDKKAISMLNSFYTAYMTAIATSTPNNFSENNKKCELLKKEYCTKKLLNDIPKLIEQSDCDPIINAQDSRMDCVKNLTFRKNLKKPNSYTVSYYYIDDYSKQKEIFTINLTLVRQNGAFKIDSIW